MSEKNRLFIFLDEWKNDKNFIESELELIKNQFDVTVVCNDFEDKDKYTYPDNVEFLFYKRKGGTALLLYLIRCFLNRDFWEEFSHLKNEDNKYGKLSEVVRFFINSECFYSFLKRNDLISNDKRTIYYTYWYFYKCFALTNHRKDIKGRIITRTHEYDLYTESIPTGYQPFKYAMDKNLDKIIFIAEHGRQYYIDKYRFKTSDKYELYHLGTKDYGLNPYKKQDELVLVSCSSVIKRKRVHHIVEALGQITDTKIHWIHFGNGDLFDELKKKASELLDSKENISYELRGYTKHDEIMDFYSKNSVDAFMMVAVSEGNPVSVMEAMSYGIPVISYDICNMPNMIKDNGVLISENSTVDDLAEAIKEFAMFDDDTVSRMRKNSRQIWEEDYNETVNNKKFLEEILLSNE